MPRFILLFLLIPLFSTIHAQKVLQLEKFGRAKTKKLYVGDVIYLKTWEYPDVWYEATIEDLIPEAQSIVFYDRILTVNNIKAIRLRKKGSLHNYGKSVQYAALAPVAYELLAGIFYPPITFALAGYAGTSFLLGALIRVLPPKTYRMNKRRRLRVLDLTFYPGP